MIKFKQAINKQWYFIVTAKNGKTLVTSEMYNRKQGAAKGAVSLKRILS
jgi:uncharacterized protein YegP (UPF0339 family)